MTAAESPLVSASSLVTYPDDGYAARVERLAAVLTGSDPETAALAEAFAMAIAPLSLTGQQELFTHTFDLNPVCALEVGWHLFGEDYERGAFLVRMRQMLAAHGISEGGELPDHLSSLLRLAAALEANEARSLVTQALQPAIAKMIEPLERTDSPFLHLMKAVQRLLAADVAAGQEAVHA